MVKTHAPLIKSVLIRLLVTFLCVIIPLYVIGINIYMWGINTMRKNIADVMQTQGTYYMNGIETDIQRIRTLQNDLVTDKNLNKLVNALPIMNKYEKVTAIQYLVDRLNAISNSNSMIDIIKVHLPGLEKSIYSSGFVDEFESEEFTIFENLRADTVKPIVLVNGILHMILAGTSYDLKDTPYTAYIIDIRLKANEFKKTLEAMVSYSSEGALLMDSRIGEIIAVKDDRNIAGELGKMPSVKNMSLINNVSQVTIDNKPYLVTSSSSRYLELALVKYVREQEIFSSVNKYQVWFLIFTLAAVIVIVLYSLFTVKFIGRPVGKLVFYFKKAEEGDLKTKIDYRFNDEFAYLYHGFNRMIQKLDEMIGQVYEQKILVQKAELKQLQSQINPHFLYNSFFIFQRTILSGDVDTAAMFSEKLGNYFKYITRNSSDDVSLGIEVEHARIYTEIQGLRFENRLTVDFRELPEKFANVLVPRLILQPLLENSFEHGLRSKARDGRLQVLFMDADGFLSIIIEDNGDQTSQENIDELTAKLADESGSTEFTGLLNIHRRIRLSFGVNSGLSVCRSELGGLKAIVTFEIRKT